MISGSGNFVTFTSRAENLVPGDTNGVADIFVRDLLAGTLDLVSRSSDGSPGNWASEQPSISNDGRYVVFISKATNFDPRFVVRHIYLHDRRTRRTIPISKAADGAPANGVSGNPSITGDGNYVVFYSWADNLVPDDTNGQTDTFVYDVRLDVTERVSISSSGSQSDSASHPAWFHGSISGDGRFVAFVSSATNLVLGDTPGTRDAFLHDRRTGETFRLSEGPDGVRFAGASRNAVISADGTVAGIVQEWPAIRSEDAGIGVSNPNADIIVLDLRSGQQEVISSPEPTPGILYKDMVSLSGDGRYVAYATRATFQTLIDNKGSENVYLYDRELGETTLVNVSNEGLPAVGGESGLPSLSWDGRRIAFASSSPTLSRDDAKTCIAELGSTLCHDAFVRDRGTAVCSSGRREEGSLSRVVGGSRYRAPERLQPALQRLGCATAQAGA